jgi:acyl-CoA thioester hydrolase
LRERLGLVFVVKNCAIDYRWPARLDDVLEVRSRVGETGRVHLTLEQRVIDSADGRNRAVLNVQVVCVDANGRPARIPDEVTDALAPYRNSL